MEAKFKHIAIVSERTEEMCDFYEAVFGVDMEESRAIFGDGYVGFNMLSRRNSNAAYINHYGFAIDSLKEFEERLNDLYPKCELIKRPSNKPFAGWGSHDPEGNAFDLSPADMTKGFVYSTLQDKPNTRHVSHFQINALEPATLAKFYQEMLDLKELPKQDGDESYYLSDGFITFVITPWKLSNFKGSIDYKPLPDHVGWHVESIEAFLEDCAKISKERPELTPKAFRDQSRLELLAQCTLGGYQLADPEGVLLDVSEL